MLIVGSSVAVSESITAYPVLSGQAIRYGLGALLLAVWVAVKGAYGSRRRGGKYRRLPRAVDHLAQRAVEDFDRQGQALDVGPGLLRLPVWV